MKQTYLMLAHTLNPIKISVGGWLLSEKLDGVRAYWDGGLSRGVQASEVPYANTIKDYRLKHEVVSTGLWSRTGKVIYAPNYWLDQLPNIPLDGELYIGPHSFQELTSIVSTKDGSKDNQWPQIEFMVFDSPPYPKMFANRKITVRDYDFEVKDAMRWYFDRVHSSHEYGCNTLNGKLIKSASITWNFEMVQDWLGRNLQGPVAKLHPQEKLPLGYHQAKERMDMILKSLIEQGAEGVMLRKPTSFWATNRSHDLLKYKPWKDDEAKIVGFTSGKETNKGSRLLGLIGALIVDYKGKRLELSGLTDEERQFQTVADREYAYEFPGMDMPKDVQSVCFKIGQIITFKYRELSNDGIPKEARYYRKRGEL